MKINPVMMYVMSRRDKDCSRAMARSMMDFVVSFSQTGHGLLADGVLAIVSSVPIRRRSLLDRSGGTPQRIWQSCEPIDRESLGNEQEHRHLDNGQFARFRNNSERNDQRRGARRADGSRREEP